jgi:hypothetical protein
VTEPEGDCRDPELFRPVVGLGGDDLKAFLLLLGDDD